MRSIISLACLPAFLIGVSPLAFAADVTQERLENAQNEPENWLTSMGDFANQRFSRLDQINRDNAGDLKVAFTVPITTALVGAASGNLQNPPLVIDGMMYLNDQWGIVYKIDARDPLKAGRILWIADPAVVKDGPQLIKATRGIAAYGDSIFANLIDGRVISVNAESGEIEWDKQVANTEEGWEYDVGEAFTAAPLATENRVLVGQSVGDAGTRGFLASLDADTGEEQWRTYTVPAPGEPGSETWKDDHNAWHTGGGSLWVTGAYDPIDRVTIWGTANPVPMYDPEFRPGDNLFTNSAIAFNIDDGSMKWYFQYTPNESWDYDEVAVHFIFDREIDGQPRRVVGHYARNGYFYELDHSNGQFIGAVQFVDKIGWTAGLDPKTGKPVEYDPNLDVQTYIPETRGLRNNRNVDVCPTHLGGIRWQPTSYNPDTMIAYAAGIDGCNKLEVQPQEPVGPEGGNPAGPGKAFIGGVITGRDVPGAITAIDVNGPTMVAKLPLQYGNLSGVLATAGGVLFTGQVDGTFNVYDDRDLKELYAFNVGISFKAPPIAYAIDGKEYIAIIAGGPTPSTYPDLATMQNGAMLYVFSL